MHSSGKLETEEVGPKLRAVLALPDALQRVAGIADTLDATDPGALPLVRAVFEDPNVATTVLDEEVFVAWWSGFDQRGPFEWVLENRRSAGGFSVVFERWGQVDPIAAAGVLAGQVPGVQSEVPTAFMRDAQVALLRGWYQSGRPGLESYLISLDPRKGGLAVMEDFGRYLVSQLGAEGTIGFIESIPEQQAPLRSKIVFAMARPITRASPETGVELFEAYREEPGAWNLLIAVGEGWVEARGAQSAMEWVLEQGDHPRQRAAVSSVYRRWIRDDEEAALAWLEPRLEDRVPPELEGALVVYIGIKSQEDVLKALELRKKIRAGLVRRDVTLKILRDWRRRDPDAANAWIDQATTLSDYVRRQLEKEKGKTQLGLQAEPTE
jgi:hypothetical protein